MAAKVGISELQQFLVVDVQFTNKDLGTGAYGKVEEVKIPGAIAAAKRLHRQLIRFGTPQQVQVDLHRY